MLDSEIYIITLFNIIGHIANISKEVIGLHHNGLIQCYDQITTKTNQDKAYGCTTIMVTSYMFIHLLGEDFIIRDFRSHFFFKNEKHIMLCDETLKLKRVCLK